MDRILAPEDDDVSKEMEKIMKKKGINIRKVSKVHGVTVLENQDCCEALIEDLKTGKKSTEKFSRVLMSIGRRANVDNLGLDKVGVKHQKNGKIDVSMSPKSLLQTSVPHI